MSRGASDGLLMIFTNINILITVAALLMMIEVRNIMVSGFGLSVMWIFGIVLTAIMFEAKYIDGFTAFFISLFIGTFQAMFIWYTVEIMMPINIWWFYYPVIYLAVWIFEGAYIMCQWGKESGCKE